MSPPLELKDLIATEYPPQNQTFGKAFKAVVGAVGAVDVERANKLVQDLVLVQLVGKNIDDI